MFFHISADTDRHQHATVWDARECEAMAAEARAEMAAELAVERYFETADWAEQAAFEDYERRLGKVTYEEARAAHDAGRSHSWYDLPIAGWAWKGDAAILER